GSEACEPLKGDDATRSVFDSAGEGHRDFAGWKVFLIYQNHIGKRPPASRPVMLTEPAWLVRQAAEMIGSNDCGNAAIEAAEATGKPCSIQEVEIIVRLARRTAAAPAIYGIRRGSMPPQ